MALFAIIIVLFIALSAANYYVFRNDIAIIKYGTQRQGTRFSINI